MLGSWASTALKFRGACQKYTIINKYLPAHCDKLLLSLQEASSRISSHYSSALCARYFSKEFDEVKRACDTIASHLAFEFFARFKGGLQQFLLDVESVVEEAAANGMMAQRNAIVPSPECDTESKAVLVGLRPSVLAQ